MFGAMVTSLVGYSLEPPTVTYPGVSAISTTAEVEDFLRGQHA